MMYPFPWHLVIFAFVYAAGITIVFYCFKSRWE
jgi:hypothetical protein